MSASLNVVVSEDAVEQVHCLGSFLHYNVGIDFSTVDVGMSQQSTCGVEVTACSESHCGEGVPGTVE